MFSIFFLQVMSVAVVASLLGASIGTLLPFAAVRFYGDALPVPPTLPPPAPTRTPPPSSPPSVAPAPGFDSADGFDSSG